MSKPRTEVEDKEYYKDIYFLYDAFSTLRNIDEIKKFIKDILTKAELRMLKRRWHIATLLLSGNDIRETASKSRTSTQTVSKVKKILDEGYGGLELAIKRVNLKNLEKSKNRIRGSSKFVKGWFR